MKRDYRGLQFGSVTASFNELRAIFPSGGSEHLLMVPDDVALSDDRAFPSTGIWSPPNSNDDLEFLFKAMATRGGWKEFETSRNNDELRDTCLVHHFHLESHREKDKRSDYRWFAFRDPCRFGNVWFNLGGTSESLDNLRPLWTSPVWMERIKKLYPWVAAKYRIRGNPPNMPPPIYSPVGERYIRKQEPNCYPVVLVENSFYISAGGRARKLDLNSPSSDDRWGVFSGPFGRFAKFFDLHPENILRQMQEAAEIADRVDLKIEPPTE